jgi:hypothetical protein
MFPFDFYGCFKRKVPFLQFDMKAQSYYIFVVEAEIQRLKKNLTSGYQTKEYWMWR